MFDLSFVTQVIISIIATLLSKLRISISHLCLILVLGITLLACNGHRLLRVCLVRVGLHV